MRLAGFLLLSLVPTACGSDPLDRVAGKAAALQDGASLEALDALLSELESAPPTPRALRLKRQLEAERVKLEIANGRKLSFDEESKLLYGAVAPRPDEGEMARVGEELEELLPGEGPLAARYRAYQARFLVPPEKLDEVLQRALKESRSRTLAHLDLPPEEKVDVEYVSGAPWPSFSTYRGSGRSLVQVNREFPLPLSSVVEIATHEGYPGHHTISVLLDDRELVGESLVRPDALLHEGLASYGIELAFPGEARLELERDVLFPLAGLDPAEAGLYFEVERRVRRLAPLRVEAAREYLDGKRDRVQSAIFLEERALVLSPWEFLRFVDRYRSYVVAYTVGPELMRRRAAGSWDGFTRLLLDLEHEA